jgi:hypothetical protein
MDLTNEDLEKINKLLVNQTNISDEDLCFCGSGNIYRICCAQKPNYWFTNEYLNKLLGFAKNKNFYINGVMPTTFLTQLEIFFGDHFNVCATPGCLNKCVYSHIFGKALLEKYFGSNMCKWYMINDQGIKELVPAGIKKEVGYKIFCSTCDNNIFKIIDDVNHDILNLKNQLLHIFRSLAYQYQLSRAYLAFAHQVILAKPAIETAREKHTGVKLKSVDISAHLKVFKDGYIGYKLTHGELKKIWGLINTKQAFNHCLITSRIVKTKDIFFAQGIENPKNDLRGNKIDLLDYSAIIYAIFPTDEKHVQIIMTSNNQEYSAFLEQFKIINEYALKKFFNTVLEKKNSPRGVFVAENKKSHQKIFR